MIFDSDFKPKFTLILELYLMVSLSAKVFAFPDLIRMLVPMRPNKFTCNSLVSILVSFLSKEKSMLGISFKIKRMMIYFSDTCRTNDLKLISP